MSTELPTDRTSNTARLMTARKPSRSLITAALAAILATGVAGMALQANLSSVKAQDSSAAAVMGRAPLSFADVVDKVKGSVVNIYVSGGKEMAELGGAPMDSFPDLPDDHPLNEFFKKFKRGQPDQSPGRRDDNEGSGRSRPLAQGSGFVISTDGYIVTNNHVVADANKVEVSFDGTDKMDADVIGTDPRTDLALLKIKDTGKTFPAVPFAKKLPRVGDWVIAVGNPFGLGGTVTAGIVSAGGRDIGSGPYDYLQIDAAVNRGNSGGPSFNLDGEVVGVNSAIFSPSGGNVGIAFAVPSPIVEQVIAQLKASGTVSRGWLGVNIQNVSDEIAQSLGMTETKGALITKITENGPSANTELKAGDAVVAVNGDKIGNSRDLARKVADFSPGTEVMLSVVRDGKETPVKIKLGTFPNEKQMAKLEQSKPATPEMTQLDDLGLALAPASVLGKPDVKDGVLITNVKNNSEAEDKGLRAGDIILEIAGKAVTTPQDVKDGIEAAKSAKRNAVLVRVKSGNDDKFIALVLTAKG
jgi:serine protease Do